MLLSACAVPATGPVVAPAPAPAASASPGEPAVETAPRPYTAEQIRDACPPGRRIVFRVVEKDRPEVLRVIEFAKSDATGTDLRITVSEPSGQVLKTMESHEGTGVDAAVTTYNFARTIPGPPVSHFTEKDGVRVAAGTVESSSLGK